MILITIKNDSHYRRTTGNRVLRLTAATSMVVGMVAACGSGDEGSDSELTVVATTTILGDVVSNVVDGDASVEVVMPLGADPHDFQASSRQVASINEADLVVANGLGLEEGLEDVLDSAADDGVAVVEVAPMLDPIPFASHAHEEEGDDHDHGTDDPHVWMDPARMADAARIIATELGRLDEGTDWALRAETYADELAITDEHIAETLSTIDAEDRKLVTNHDSLGYFADAYGFEIVGVVIPGGSTLGDPSSEDLAGLIEVMRSEGVDVVFAETTEPADLAEAVAAELGEDVRVEELYTGSLGEPGGEAGTLIGMLETNAQRIADALGG